MPSFPPGAIWFAVAGVAAASVPVVLHLINRRRVRVIPWAAMDFLRVSIQRSRRLLQLRDLLLMLVRAALLILFGLALARPYFAFSSGKLESQQALYAVLLMDNSLSMGYQQTGGTLLDESKRKAREYVDRLPAGSRVAVIPLCGTPAGYRLEAFASPDDAREAIDSIEVVNRATSSSQAATLAAEAARLAPPNLAQRLVLFSDQQETNWPSQSGNDWKGMSELQLVPIGPPQRDNAWVSDFRVQDAVADVETPTVLHAVINYIGHEPRKNVEVVLSFDGEEAEHRTVDLDSGQVLNLTFEHTFKVDVEPGRPTYVSATLSLTPDRLPADDTRSLVVPVVSALPVVFVDDLGPKERPQDGVYGETYQLRKLLAPVTSKSQPQVNLIKIRHLALDELTRENLADVRLVVMSGVADPLGAVDVLRQYVLQGGQLVIAAGSQFDPAAWNRAAWKDGAGILPLPLDDKPYGETLAQATATVHPLKLAVDSLTHDYFTPPQIGRKELAEIYGRPFFFKAVKVTADEATRKAAVQAEAKRIAEQIAVLSESDRQRKKWAEQETRGRLDAQTQQAREVDEARRAEIEPHWLAWDNPRQTDPAVQRPAEGETVDALAARLAEKTQPAVIASFDNQMPYIVERPIGRGRVTLLSSGTRGDWTTGWNTLGLEADALLYDRLLRGRLESTLPDRNLASVDQTTLPIKSTERNSHFTLTRPGGKTEDLQPQFLDATRFGLTVKDLTKRGVYTVTARAPSSADLSSADLSSADAQSARVLWQAPLAVNGPARESAIATVSEQQLRERLEGATVVVLGRDQEVPLQGSRIVGEWLWKWLILAVLLLLLVERAIVARASTAPEATA